MTTKTMKLAVTPRVAHEDIAIKFPLFRRLLIAEDTYETETLCRVDADGSSISVEKSVSVGSDARIEYTITTRNAGRDPLFVEREATDYCLARGAYAGSRRRFDLLVAEASDILAQASS